MNRTYQNISGSLFPKPIKMRDLEINKEYFIKKGVQIQIWVYLYYN